MCPQLSSLVSRRKGLVENCPNFPGDRVDREPFACHTLLIAILLVIGCQAVVGADDASARYFRALRDRRLFSLAESSCQHRLSRADLSPDDRAELTLELAITQSEHAKFVSQTEAAEFWHKAQSSLTELLARDPQNPRRILLEAEAALIPATEGEWLRWQAELMPYDSVWQTQAQQSLNAAIPRLRALDTRIAAQSQKPVIGNDAGRRLLLPSELRVLLMKVRSRLAAAELNLSAIEPLDAPHRAARLQEAEKRLRSLTESAAGDEITWGSWIMLVECQRLMGKPSQALAMIKSIEVRMPPVEVLDRLTAERVRLLMQAQQALAAERIISTYARTRQPLPGELAYLHIQVLGSLVQALIARQADETADELFGLIEERAALIARDLGGYWSYRCAVLLEQLRDEQRYGARAAPLVRRAQAEFSQGRFAESIETYGQAAAAAETGGQPALAFTLGFQRASIQTQDNRWGDAAQSFGTLAAKFPDNPKAADARLLEAFALGKLYEEKPTRTRREQFTAALRTHRQKFAGTSSADEATWMLAQHEERRGQFTVALQLYRQIPSTHARGLAAQTQVARCYEQILQRLRELGQPSDEWESEAVTVLEEMLQGPSARTSPFDLHQSELAVRLARLLLQRRQPGFAAADHLLARVFAGFDAAPVVESTPPDVRAEQQRLRAYATQLRVISLAGQGQAQQAGELLDQLSAAGPAELLRILDGLSKVVSTASETSRRNLGELQLRAAEQLSAHRSELTAPEQRHLDECLASAFVETGQSRRAIELYALLLKTSPRDKSLLNAYADVLERCGTMTCLKTALATWKTLESLSAAGSDEWLAARFHVCQVLFRTHDIAACRKLLKTTRLLYPKLGDEKLKARFVELEANCEAGK